MPRLSDFELRTMPGLWRWADDAPRRMAFRAGDRAEAAAWQAALREEIVRLLGGFPAARCDLDPHAIERVEGPDLTRETLVIQTQPGEYMPVHVLIPRGGSAPWRRVIAVHGHGTGGARLLTGEPADPVEAGLVKELNYDYARQMARRGFLVFVPVLRALGDRMEDPALRDAVDPAWQSSCHVVSMSALLCGKTLIGLRAWDMLRLVDYIETRAEPAAPGLACAGLSGGGTVTLFTAALEPRITCAVISGYLNTFRDSIMAVRHCACNYVPGILNVADMADIAGLIAPRPVFIESGENDPIFPPGATRRALDDLRRVYRVFGAEDRLASRFFPGAHEWGGAPAIDWLEEQFAPPPGR